jgi:Host cell surface-exposed lipoprotein
MKKFFVLLAALAATSTVVVGSAFGSTIGQRQALESAKSYLSDGGFSRAGLIQQLTSKYGEGFSHADAVWAVNHAHANWNAEAVESAKSYLSDGGFSRAGLIQQLESPYGEGFTHAQALYAVSVAYR